MVILSPLMITLRKAGSADADAIVTLADYIWRIHYTPIIGPEQVDFMLSTMHNAAKVKEQMESGHSFFFICSDGKTIGYLSWSVPANGELFIHKFYIDPKEQGRGLGKQAFRELLELNPGTNTIRLTVNRKNYKSINFYYRLGFTIEEVKDFDIGAGYFMNDFVMVWRKNS